MSDEYRAPNTVHAPLRGVIFDLGGTLIDFYPGGDWQYMEHTGAVSWHGYLTARGYAPPDVETVKIAVWEQMEAGWFSIGQGRDGELTLGRQLQLAAERMGLTLKPEDVAGAERSFISPVQAQLEPLPGAAETLAALRARGLRLGLISNTMWPGPYHEEDLARFGLLEALEALFFSGEEGVWKPNPEIFHRALRALDLKPEEAAYIGDSRMFDVKGAQDAGMRGVWVENDDPYSDAKAITPDATIRRLLDLLPIVDTWT